MAAFTTNATGNWSAAGTWTTAPPTGGPDIGDTVTFGGAHTVTIDGAAGGGGNGIVKIGTGSGTCITGPNTGTATLTVGNGNQLWLRGNVVDRSGGLFLVNIGSTAGASLIFDPPNNSTQFHVGGTVFIAMSFNGTTGQHAVAKTDFTRAGGSGLAGYLDDGSNVGGVLLATYTDFTDLGDTTNVGIQTNAPKTVQPNVVITNCTFLRCNYTSFSTSTPWDFTFTFSNNIFTSSVLLTLSGNTLCCAGFTFTDNRTTGVRTIDSCSFDGGVLYGDKQIITSNNYFGDYLAMSGSWPSDSYWLNNFITSGRDTFISGANGNMKDTYMLSSASTNPHYLGISNSLTAGTITGFIFESNNSGAGGTGDCIFPPTIAGGTPTLTVKNCIVLPDATGFTSGKLLSCLQGSKVALTVEHNTYSGFGGEHGLIGMDEGGSSYIAEVASCRANLVWGPSASASDLAIKSSGAGTPAVDAVTLAGYNWFWNPGTGTCFYNTVTSQAGVTGYSAIKVSNANPYPNAQVGTGDQSGEPLFVGSTRALATWGGTPAGGGVATVAGALAALAANPALIAQATTGLLAWVRAGFVPTNPLLVNASYGGDASTTDAAGNSWPGGGPGIGALGYRPAVGTRLDVQAPGLPGAILAI